MAVWKKTAALLLGLCMAAGLFACGAKREQNDGLHPRFSTLYATDFPQEFLDDPETYAPDIAGFGVSDFAGTFVDPQSFRCYNAEILLTNENDFAVNILSLKVEPKNVGKNGVYISMFGDGVTVGLPANFSKDNAVYYMVIADANLTTDEVLQTLEDMQVKVLFVDAATGVETAEEADDAQIMESLITRAG